MKGAFLLFSLYGAFADPTPSFTTKDGETSATCPNVTVLNDVTSGWYDACLGLTKQVDKGTEELCSATCWDDMLCSVWQLVKNGDTPTCYSGSVYHGCLARGGTDASGKPVSKFEGDLTAGQHIQHGFIKKVSDNTAETKGLKHFIEKTGEDDEKMARCKKICYTDSTCTVWQYGKDGCWFEHLPENPKGEQVADSEWTKTMMAGETIEHTCPPYVAPEGLPWPWIIAGIVLGLLALAAIIYAMTKKPKVKKTRAVKIEPKPEPQQVMYLIPQPTMLIPQTSVVQVPQYQPIQQVQQVVSAAPTTAMSTPLMMPAQTVIR